MTESLISLISIVIGLLGSHLTAYSIPKYSYGFVGNTIAGVFGSIFIIKSLGRLGFDPISIMDAGSTNWSLCILNFVVSFIGGGLSLLFIKKLQNRLESKEKFNMNSINTFRVISFLEGLSYILLLFIAVPLKYLADQGSMVKLLGMPHGILFITYIILALIIRAKMKWNIQTTMLVLVASLLPFGTFYIDRKFFSHK